MKTAARTIDRVDPDVAALRLELQQLRAALEQHLHALELRLTEPLADLVAEMQVIRQLLVDRPMAPTSTTPEARAILALAATLRDLDLTFDATEVLEAARLDHALDQALQAIGPVSTEMIGLWLRSCRDRPIAGFIPRRDGRGWRLERCT